MIPRRRWLAGLVFWLVGGDLSLHTRAAAHDIPNARIERATQVILSPGQLTVEYEVALGELTLIQDLRQFDDGASARDRPALYRHYAQIVGPLNARGFLVQVDGNEVEFGLGTSTIVVDDHPRFKFRFQAVLPAHGHLVLVDTNYASSEGTARLACDAVGGVTLAGDLPATRVDLIPIRAAWQLTDAEERHGRRLDVNFGPGPAVVVLKPDAPGPAVASGPRDDRPNNSNLLQLLDLRSGTTVTGWVVLAFVLGMIHAVQPGHGKSLVTAATLGATGPGTARGFWLGLTAAACHLIGVVVLAALLWASATTRFGPIHLIAARAAGFMIASVGAFRIGRGLAGIEDGHQPSIRSNASLLSLGLAAGFVPCWEAVSLLVFAAATDQLGRGLFLLVAFSAGMAVVLGAVGWGAGRIRGRAVASSWGSASIRWLGLGSGLMLAVVGLGLLRY